MPSNKRHIAQLLPEFPSCKNVNLFQLQRLQLRRKSFSHSFRLFWVWTQTDAGCLHIILSCFFFNSTKSCTVEVLFSLLMKDSGEEPLGGFEDRGIRCIFAEQTFGLILEGLGDGQWSLAEVQENQAAFNNVGVRIHLRGNADKEVIVH